MGHVIYMRKGETHDTPVALPPVGTALNDCTWRQIGAIAEKGLGSNYFSIGDRKEITLNGTVGSVATSNLKVYVYVIGFEHNGASGTIDFGTFKTALSNGTDITLVSATSPNSSTNGTKYFNMNHWGNYNYGGWKGCDLRYDILGSTDKAPSGYGSAATTSRAGYDATETCATDPVPFTLMAALPSELRAVMRPIVVHTNNTGGSAAPDTCVTPSVDYLPLMSECEIFGSKTYCHSAEPNYQKQYSYYANGNEKRKTQYTASGTTGSYVNWWTRSPRGVNSVSDNGSFCNVTTSGAAGMSGAYYYYGLAPIFRVGSRS